MAISRLGKWLLVSALLDAVRDRCRLWELVDIYDSRDKARRQAAREFVSGAYGTKVKPSLDGWAVFRWDITRSAKYD